MSQHSARGRAWSKLCAAVRKNHPPICGLCAKPIDLSLKYPHPMSWSCDHIISPRDRPDLKMTYSNLRPSHLVCNQKRGDGAPRKNYSPTNIRHYRAENL